MSHFRPSKRTTQIYMRPMLEFVKENETGHETTMKLFRWGRRNGLFVDFRAKSPKRYESWRYHEPLWVQRKRYIREYWTRKWKEQVNNTADMALWWKFRVHATDDHDKEQYDNYLKQRRDKRIMEMRQENRYNSWNTKELVQEKEKIVYQKSFEETLYLNSIKPTTYLENLRNKFVQKDEEKALDYDKWNQISNTNDDDGFVENSQAIQAKGISDVRGSDWIKYQQTKSSSFVTRNDDVDYNAKLFLWEQSKSDHNLMDDIIKEQQIIK